LHTVSGQNPIRASQFLLALLTELEEENIETTAIKDYARRVLGEPDENLDKKIVESIISFKKRMTGSKGTRPTETQQAMHAVYTAALQGLDEKDQQSARRRLKIRESPEKALKRIFPPEKHDYETYCHNKRASRKDQKIEVAQKYVNDFCHNEDSDRASKIDTGEYRIVKVIEDGELKSHHLRRWMNACKKSEVYKMWEVSRFAEDFKKEYPKLKTIGLTLFWQLACPCCRFAKKDMCSDIIMTGLEEASRGLENAFKNNKSLRKKINHCRCAYHTHERMSKLRSIDDEDDDDDSRSINSNDSAYNVLRDINDANAPDLSAWLSDDESDYSNDCSISDDDSFGFSIDLLNDETNDNRRVNDETDSVVISMDECEVDINCNDSDLDVSNGDSNNEIENRGHGNMIIEDDNNNNDEDDIFGFKNSGEKAVSIQFTDFIRLQGEAQICHTCCDPQEYPELAKFSIYGDATSEKKVPKLIHPDCVNGCKQCGIGNTFSGLKECPLFFGPTTTSLHDVESESGHHLKKYPCKVWKDNNIARTTKKQKELVEEQMTLKELVNHYLICLFAARRHYVMYKIVDWNQDLYRSNTVPQQNTVVMYTDFAATPNLSGLRTATGAVDTHAVLAIFITYEYTTRPDGTTKCTKKSHQFIGSTESAGKKNNWIFHVAAQLHTALKLVNQNGTVKVVCFSDRCPGQYLCRHYMLQIAIFSKSLAALQEKLAKEDVENGDVNDLASHFDRLCNVRDFGVTCTHSYAVRYRFKGEHDKEGKVAKCGVQLLAKKGKETRTAFDMYRVLKEEYSFCKEDVEQNKLNERIFYYVVYDEDEYACLNVGDDKGHIVFADMENKDDTKPIDDTTSIYSVRGFDSAFKPTSNELDRKKKLEEAGEILYEFDRCAGVFTDTPTCNDDTFLELFNTSDELCECKSSLARYDFINLQRGNVDVGEFILELTTRSREYMKQFLLRTGKRRVLTATKNALSKCIIAWLHQSPEGKLTKHRRKSEIVELYKKMCRADPKPNMTQKKMMTEILGPDWNMSTEEDDENEVYYIEKSNLNCGCQNCLLRKESKECLSPFKAYMKSKIVRLKNIKSDSPDNGSMPIADEEEGSEHELFDDIAAVVPLALATIEDSEDGVEELSSNAIDNVEVEGGADVGNTSTSVDSEDGEVREVDDADEDQDGKEHDTDLIDANVMDNDKSKDDCLLAGRSGRLRKRPAKYN
jgi:hypothetical protein